MSNKQKSTTLYISDVLMFFKCVTLKTNVYSANKEAHSLALNFTE
ncbi:Uncharacterised protein [Bacillus freudenreichii]|nr:Uncharacterised protein [Bacillus freudenreichii]